jgi:hypothetical protein
MKPIVFSWLAILLTATAIRAQITGATPVPAGSRQSYNYSQKTLVSPTWQVSGGTKISESQSFGSYTVVVQWGTTNSSGTITLFDNNMFVASKTVSILPAAPTATAASSIGSFSFYANWNAVSNASSYALEVSTASTFTSIVRSYNTTSIKQFVSGLNANTIHYYRVRAISGAGESPNSNVVSATTLIPPPASAFATNVTTFSFTANWSPVGGATSYRLDVSGSPAFLPMLPGYENLTVSATSQTVSGLSAGTDYYFRIRAVNGSGTSDDQPVPGTTRTITTPPVAGAAVAVTAASFTASWNQVKGADSYRVDVSTSGNFTSFVNGYYDLTVPATSLSVTGLKSNTGYYYRVRAYNSAGASASSGVVGVTTLPLPPATVFASAVEPFSFTANWTQVSGAIEYRLDVATDNAFTQKLADYNNMRITGITCSVRELKPQTTYYFRVRTVAPGGTSANSSTVSILTPGQFAGQGENYIVTNMITTAGVSKVEDVNVLNRDQRIQNVEYFDGLGRTKQKIQSWSSPSKNDLIQPVTYDKYGRETRKYLPVALDNKGWFKSGLLDANGNYTGAVQNFYNNSADDIADDARPFSETLFESSPLNRAVSEFLPGNNWFVNSKCRVYESLSNSTSREKVIAWEINSSGLPVRSSLSNSAVSGGFYQSGQLRIQSVKDENGTEIREYQDKEGRIVLKKVQVVENPSLDSARHWAQTYYIYSPSGLLQFVLQPELVKSLLTIPGSNPAQSDLDNLAFQYKYDFRKRMVEKKVPGSARVYYVYDSRDRLVLTQDGNQRSKSTPEWLFTKYDALGRPVMTGIYLFNSSRTGMQDVVDHYYGNLQPTQGYFEQYVGASTGNLLGYDNRSFPQTVSANCYTVIYYDMYDDYMVPPAYGYRSDEVAGQPAVNFKFVKGLPTAALVKNLGDGSWMRTVNYYDEKYRLIQVMADHHKGNERTTKVFDFTGKVISTKRSYTVSNTTLSVREIFTYDHAGRLLTTKHTVNSSPEVILADNKYNELGQLSEKDLFSAGGPFGQSVDYRYNIRGWLTKINGSDIRDIAPGDASPDYFGMELSYDEKKSGLPSREYYNGDISAMVWSKGSGGDVATQAYTFTYDPLNRMLNADHSDYKAGLWQSNANPYGEALTYDLNGNIKTLQRKTFGGLLIDDLVYYYAGNQLQNVTEKSDPNDGFINGNNSGTDDYSYDQNGNLWKDRNKGLLNNGDIRYNFLNLPEEIIKGTEKLRYIYDATGRKLAQEVYSGTILVKRTDYIGDLLYEGINVPVVQFIQHSEGRVLPDGQGWEYQYHMKDHLGNIRLTFTTRPQTSVSFSANFENGTPGSGQNDFLNYSSTSYDLVDHTDGATAYEGVQWLNGGAGGRVGVAKSFVVMPGDEITLSAFVKYMNISSTPNQNAFGTALASAFGVSALSTGEQLKIYNGLTRYASTIPMGEHAGDNESVPKCFVTILLFDHNFNFLDAAWDQVSSVGAQTSGQVKQPPHDLLSVMYKVKEGGFAYIFVSNEHPTFVDVYFDDVTVLHKPSQIVASTDYYPFGLTYNSSEREKGPKQKYKFNAVELQDDLGLNVYGAVYRNLDPAIGRWWGIDSKFNFDQSPYVEMRNNPVLYADALGDTTRYYNIETGELLGTINNEGAVKRVKISAGIYNAAIQNSKAKKVNLDDQSSANSFVNSITEAAMALENSMSSFYMREVNLISFETSQSLSFAGSTNANNSGRADGQLNVITHFDDGSSMNIASYSAISGPYENGAAPNGDYTVDNGRARNDNPGMIRDGVGFSFDMTPNFPTQRNHLRIHPDGNNAGTQGCVGVRENNQRLREFYGVVSGYVNSHGNMPMNISVNGNPNNHGGNGSRSNSGRRE